MLRQFSPMVLEISATVMFGFISKTFGLISLLNIKKAFIGRFNLLSFLLEAVVGVEVLVLEEEVPMDCWGVDLCCGGCVEGGNDGVLLF